MLLMRRDVAVTRHMQVWCRCESRKYDEDGLTYEITTSNCGPVIKKNVNNVPEQNIIRRFNIRVVILKQH
jgi:hypothetical protein